MHNRAFHQYIQKDISNTSPIMATRSPTSLPTENLKLQQGIQRRLISIQTPSIVSQASFSTEAIVPQEPTIHSSYETKTGTWQYVIADPSTLKAVIIDSVLDYDPATQVISTQTADSLVSLISENGYKIEKILETHAHADHLTAASYLQNRVGQQQGYRPPVCIGKRITQVQDLFGQRYGIPVEEYKGAFDQLFDDDESFKIGNLTATVTHLPGHTPDHIGYMIGGERTIPEHR
jgi:glyoxylase-like metal-dependent hydrolase (beta-lactamase superfamily II)